jgi:hypothetical protein
LTSWIAESDRSPNNQPRSVGHVSFQRVGPSLCYVSVLITRLAAESRLSMPERPLFEPSSKVVISERVRRPKEPPPPNASVPLIDDAVRVWLSSEFVDPSEYFRFDPPVAVYEAAGWPLGVQVGRNNEERVAMSGMRDGYFDEDVACALTLPRRYTGLSFRPPHRRDAANLWIRHVGRWDGDPHRLTEIVAGLARLPKGRHPGYKYHALYALTPFSIIGQIWCERDASEPAFIVDTTIAFFYTFDTLIQECFITDARRAGASTADIVAAYEHRYANARAQPNVLLRDPTTLKLARYANRSIDWDRFRATPENSIGGSVIPGWEARSSRKYLFLSRLETHLNGGDRGRLPGPRQFRQRSRSVRARPYHGCAAGQRGARAALARAHDRQL